LARKSNTEAILVMRVEAKTEQSLAQMIQIIEQRVSPILDISKLLNA
jgi:phosphomannomutase